MGTLDFNASVIEYDGFLASGAAVLSPALYHAAHNFSLGAQGTWVIFESGNEILQGTAAAAWLSPSRNGWRAELSGSLGGSKYADAPSFGYALGRTRVHFQSERAGAWVSGLTGGTWGAATNETPFELSVGAWTVEDRLAVVGTVTRSWLAGLGYVDLVGAARWSTARVQLDALAGVRPWAEAGGEPGEPRTGVYGELSARVFLAERLSVAVSGGRYPSDPVRAVLGAEYVTVGLRLNLFGTRVSTVPAVARAIERGAAELAASEHASPARLVIAESRFPQTLRVHVSGADSVEVMGDFTDWQPVALTPVDAATWEIQVRMMPGVHRLNVRIDGGPWLVPQGTRLEETEFGGAVGVVVVP